LTALIDIHAHNYYTYKNGILLLNVFPGESEKLNYPCYFSIGLHPWNINEATLENNLYWVEQIAVGRRILAVGETGLDKATNTSWPLQVYVFERQLALAQKLEKPLIIHCVRAYSEMLAYRSKSGQKLPWVFHWFNASLEIANELIRKNCYLSFGHMLFNEKSKAFNVFKAIPAESIFLETDDTGYDIGQIYERASQVRGISMQELIMQINKNFTTCFGKL
jgi:TatD DNase family protein